MPLWAVPFPITGVEKLATVWRMLAATLGGGVALVAFVLVSRRAAGALEEPLDGAALLCIGVSSAAITAALRFSHPHARLQPRSPALWIMQGAFSLVLIAMAWAISLPGTSPAALLTLWLVVVAEEVWAWRALRPWRQEEVSHAGVLSPAAEEQLPIKVEAPAAQEQIWQYLKRARTAEGSDVAAGWVQVEFRAGQRTDVTHVAFCPPFDATPQFHAWQSSGPGARVKETQVLPYGVRLEIKLQEDPTEPQAVKVEFSAQTPAQPTAAAAGDE